MNITEKVRENLEKYKPLGVTEKELFAFPTQLGRDLWQLESKFVEIVRRRNATYLRYWIFDKGRLPKQKYRKLPVSQIQGEDIVKVFFLKDWNLLLEQYLITEGHLPDPFVHLAFLSGHFKRFCTDRRFELLDHQKKQYAYYSNLMKGE